MNRFEEPGPTGVTAKPIRVFILDDHELVRRGLQELLESEGFEVVGMSGSAEEATRRIPALHPDVAVLDARLPDGTGIEVCRDVRSVDPALNCLILTSYDDEQALRGAVLAGAAGYILKEIGELTFWVRCGGQRRVNPCSMKTSKRGLSADLLNQRSLIPGLRP